MHYGIVAQATFLLEKGIESGRNYSLVVFGIFNIACQVQIHLTFESQVLGVTFIVVFNHKNDFCMSAS